MRKESLIGLAILTIAGIIYSIFFYFSSIRKVPFSGHPRSMPPVVDETMDELLRSLEIEIERHFPEVIQSLEPGITAEAEAALGHVIHPEMQTLYRWHNGLANGEELFPGHSFWSLENAIRTNQELAVQYREKGVSLLMAHEKNWLILFPDAAGDGYYYDPKTSYDTGGVFHNFRENSYYRYFPSIRNLLKAIIECYQNGVYPQGSIQDFELEDTIMDKYGIANMN